MNYDVDYFIQKFEAIPENLWCIGKYFRSEEGFPKCCALGHCGARELHFTKEADALIELFRGSRATYNSETFYIPSINDGFSELFKQFTPKQRILAALKFIKEKQNG